MKILVYFNITSDYDYVLDKEWEEKENLDLAFVKKIYGCFDEGALETALRLKDEYKEKNIPVFLTAVTAGLRTSALMTGLYGAGFDEVIYVDTGEEKTFVQKETVPYSVLMPILKEKNPDIILTGRMSGGLDERMAAPEFAGKLGMPWLMDGVELHPGKQEGEILVLCEQDSEYILYRQKIPFVCSIGNASHGVLRMFSLKARMEAKKKKITEVAVSPESADSDVIFQTKEKKGVCQWMTGEKKELAKQLKHLIRRGQKEE